MVHVHVRITTYLHSTAPQTPVQVAMRTHMCSFASVNVHVSIGKHHQLKLQRIKTIFSTDVRKHIWVGNCTGLVVVLVCVCGQVLCNIAVKLSPYSSVCVSLMLELELV